MIAQILFQRSVISAIEKKGTVKLFEILILRKLSEILILRKLCNILILRIMRERIEKLFLGISETFSLAEIGSCFSQIPVG